MIHPREVTRRFVAKSFNLKHQKKMTPVMKNILSKTPFIGAKDLKHLLIDVMYALLCHD